MDDPTEIGSEAARLKRVWELRARSDSRDFYVASHEGWDDDEAWAAQARQDIAFITTGLDAGFLADVDVLELGCGVGRLVPELLRRTRSYTGFDVAPSMVDEARRRLAGEPRARFFESDGLGVPAGAYDREYGLVVSLAVLIHCPSDVVHALVHAGWNRLRRGGVMRFQLRALPSDESAAPSVAAARPKACDDTPSALTPSSAPGLSSTPSPSSAPGPSSEAARSQQTAPRAADTGKQPDLGLVTEHYMGDSFTEESARRLVADLAADETLAVRVPPCHIYVSLRKT